MNTVDIQRFTQHLPGLFLVVEAADPFTIVAASADYLERTHADGTIVGRPLFEAFPDNPAAPRPGGAARLRESYQAVRARRATDVIESLRYDVRRPRAEGGEYEERFWTITNAPILGDDGEVRFIVHRIEEASAKARRDAVAILESIGEGFFTLDRKWRFDFVNREAHRILGRNRGTLEGRTLWSEYPGLEGTEFERSYRRTMDGRETSSFTAHYSGDDRWYEVSTFPAPEGISVYFRDVTAARRMQQDRETLVVASERQRLIYEAALNNTPDFVYVFDTAHRALYANEALLRVWGVDDVRGKTWMELGYEQWHADMHDAELDQVIRTRAPIRGEIPFTGTNGTRVYDYIFAPVFGPGGEVVAVAGTTRDITDRQAAEQSVRDQAARLAEADRTKDEFLATLSHELRNPLAPLLNSLAILRHIESGNPKSDAIRAIMERQVNHLVRLVDDLLELTRISKGTLVLRKGPVEVATVVRNAIETSLPLVEAGGHRLDVQLHPEPLWLEGDAVRLAQVLSNLLNNSAKYTDDRGEIQVRSRREGGQAVISVRDNGIGIEPQELSRMFEMFSRGDRDSGRHQGGLGVGLALARRLAQMHGGSLEGHSEGRGRGSEFTIRLPLVAAPAVPDGQGGAPRAGGDLEHLRVLVVDDNQDAGDSLGEILELLGAQVRVARSGPEALQVLEDFQARVALLDIGMPGMNGYELARAMQGRWPGRRIELIALTGWGQEDDRRRAREAGFRSHLTKPADIDQLRSLLGAVAA